MLFKSITNTAVSIDVVSHLLKVKIMEKYNGFSSRETRLVNLYFDFETKEELESIKDYIENYVNNIDCLFIKDLINLNHINWVELEKFN